MQKRKAFVLALTAMFIFGAHQLWAADTATPKEVKEKCEAAAKVLSEKGEAALPEFNDSKGPWVFVAATGAAPHPIGSQRQAFDR